MKFVFLLNSIREGDYSVVLFPSQFSTDVSFSKRDGRLVCLMGEMHSLSTGITTGSWSAEITYVGLGEYSGSIMDGLRREMDDFRGTLKEVKGWIQQTYAGLPVQIVPFRLS